MRFACRLNNISGVPVGLLMLALVVSVTPEAAATEPAGRAVLVRGQASVERADGDTQTLRVGDFVHQGDRVRTGAAGRVEIDFADDSRIVLSAGGDLRIEAYLFQENTQERESVFSLWSGRLRSVVSSFFGGSDDPRYKVKTPTSVAGVRGTDFLVEVKPRSEEEIPEQSAESAPELFLTEISVLDGVVGVQNPLLEGGGEVSLNEAMQTVVRFKEPPEAPTPIARVELDRIRRRNASRREDRGGAPNSVNDPVGAAASELGEAVIDDIESEDAGGLSTLSDDLGGSDGGEDEMLPPIRQDSIDADRLDRAVPASLDVDVRVFDERAPEAP